jgi:hypothetical protein
MLIFRNDGKVVFCCQVLTPKGNMLDNSIQASKDKEVPENVLLSALMMDEVERSKVSLIHKGRGRKAEQKSLKKFNSLRKFWVFNLKDNNDIAFKPQH